jgi:hypothetical protein
MILRPAERLVLLFSELRDSASIKTKSLMLATVHAEYIKRGIFRENNSDAP